eukprot:gene394-1790_t
MSSVGAVRILNDVNVSKILGVMSYFDIFLNSDTVTEEKVAVDADMLGLRIDYLTKLRQVVLESLGIFDRCPEMWHATNKERLWRLMESSGGESSGGVLEDLHDIMRISYIPLDMDGEWLFGGLKPVCRSSDEMLSPLPCESLTTDLPCMVRDILSKYAGKLVLVGGGVLGLVGNSSLVKPGSDYDLFFVGVTEDEATDILDEVGTSYTEEGCTVLCTKHAMTIVTNPANDELSHKKVIQLIFRLHSTCAHVIMGFDIAPSKILAYYESSQDEDEPLVMRVQFAPTWLPAMRHAFFTTDLFCLGRGSIARIFNYMYKGFNCFVPAGKRHLMDRNRENRCIKTGRYYDKALIYNQSSGANDEDQKKYRFQPTRRMGMFYPMDAVFEEVYPDMLRSPELFRD